MTPIPNIGQLKQLVAHLQSVIFPDYFPAIEAPADLCLPAAFWAAAQEIWWTVYSVPLVLLILLISTAFGDLTSMSQIHALLSPLL